MYATEAVHEIDPALVTKLSEKIANFIENTDTDLAKAELRVADIEIDGRNLLDAYSLALRDELCSRFKERLYYVSVNDYIGRNGRRFIDITIEMKRGLLI